MDDCKGGNNIHNLMGVRLSDSRQAIVCCVCGQVASVIPAPPPLPFQAYPYTVTPNTMVSPYLSIGDYSNTWSGAQISINPVTSSGEFISSGTSTSSLSDISSISSILDSLTGTQIQ